MPLILRSAVADDARRARNEAVRKPRAAGHRHRSHHLQAAEAAHRDTPSRKAVRSQSAGWVFPPHRPANEDAFRRAGSRLVPDGADEARAIGGGSVEGIFDLFSPCPRMCR